MVSGPTRACAASSASVGGVARSSLNRVQARSAIGASVTTTSTSAGTAARMAAPYRAPLAANTSPGVVRRTMWRSFSKSREISE